MPLQQADIRFARSTVMADVPEGGGPPTSQLIPDGASNTVFPDVSEESRATGRVEIRQLHTVLRNMDTAPLLGSNVILADLPDDANVDITLMSTKNPFATRDQIVEAIEGSMSASVEFAGYLLENHGVNQRSVQIFQRPGMEPPGVGKVYVLLWREGEADERRQRVRIKSVEKETRLVTATVNGALVDFQAQIVTAEIFEPLRYAFPGSPAAREFARADGKTVIRETVYSDAGMFFGAARLTAPADVAESELRLDTVYSRLVPNSRTEAISVDQRPAAQRMVVLADAPRRVEVGVTPHTQRVKIGVENVGFSYVFQLLPLPAPGTIVVQYWAMGQRYVITDDGEGHLTGSGAGMINYLTGTVPVTLSALPDIGTIVAISWGTSTVFDDRSGMGASIRPPEYAWELGAGGAVGYTDQRIKPGTLQVTYPSGGVIKTVTDDGAGGLTGDGAGIVDYVSRRLLLRPSHMPDAGSTFGVQCSLGDLVSDTFTFPAAASDGSLTLALSDVPIAGTVSVSWQVNQLYSASGGARVNAVNTSKRDGSVYALVYQPGVSPAVWSSLVVSAGSGGGGGGGASTVRYDSVTDANYKVARSVRDDGAGNMPDGGGIDYAGKQITIQAVNTAKTVEAYKSDYQDAAQFSLALTDPGAGWEGGFSLVPGAGSYATARVWESIAGDVVVTYATSSSTSATVDETFTPPGVSIDLCPYTAHSIVPGSVQFLWMGHTYQDADGKVYRDRTAMAPGVESGSINYATGHVIMTDYEIDGSGPADFTLQSLWTMRAQWTTASLFFNTSSAPLRAGGGGFTLSVVDVQGDVLTANVNSSGVITGDHMWGKVQFSTGSVELQFGDFVPDSSLSSDDKAEWWYKAGDIGAVQAEKIWRPWPVDPTTLRYSIVSFIYLPIDSDLLGLDPTALPPDGLVAASDLRFGLGPRGQVSDLVKVNGAAPTLGYKVRLYRAEDGVCVAQTWSAPGTGVYAIDDLALDATYIPVALDHTGTHKPVAAGPLTPHVGVS